MAGQADFSTCIQVTIFFPLGMQLASKENISLLLNSAYMHLIIGELFLDILTECAADNWSIQSKQVSSWQQRTFVLLCTLVSYPDHPSLEEDLCMRLYCVHVIHPLYVAIVGVRTCTAEPAGSSHWFTAIR